MSTAPAALLADAPDPTTTPAADAPVPAAQAEQKKTEQDETVELPRFNVTTKGDKGYLAENSVSGTRINTPIKDLPFVLKDKKVARRQKLEAWYHLTANISYPLMIVLSTLLLPAMVIRLLM